MKGFTIAKPFLHCFILQFLSKIVWSILWVVCWSIDLCAQFNMVLEPQQDKALLLLQIHTWINKKKWAKLLLPTLHQKRIIYHINPKQMSCWSSLLDELSSLWRKFQKCRLLTLLSLLCNCRYNFKWIHQFLFSPHPQAIHNGIWRWLHLLRHKISMRCLWDMLKSLMRVRMIG